MYDVDYKNIFVLTVKFDTLWIFLIIIALENLECHQMNVNNVFKFFFKKIIYIAVFPKVNVAFNCILYILHNLYNLK